MCTPWDWSCGRYRTDAGSCTPARRRHPTERRSKTKRGRTSLSSRWRRSSAVTRSVVALLLLTDSLVNFCFWNIYNSQGMGSCCVLEVPVLDPSIWVCGIRLKGRGMRGGGGSSRINFPVIVGSILMRFSQDWMNDDVGLVRNFVWFCFVSRILSSGKKKGGGE